MLNILKKLFLFSLPIILILSTIEYFTRQGNSLYKEKWSGLIENADSIEVLILGSSQAMDGIDPSKFDLYAYNMAFGQQSLYFDKAITLKNLDILEDLKYVLINLSYDSFYSTHNNDRDIFYHYYYDIDYKDKTFYKEDLSMIYAFGFKQAIRNYMMHPPYNSNKGYPPPYDSTNFLSLKRDIAKERIGEMNFDENIKKEVIGDLSEFIKILKMKKIKPILMTLPHHKYYNEALDKKIILENYRSIDSICRVFDIKYLNYMKEPLGDSLFYNLDHLNKYGAQKLSLRVNGIINNEEKLMHK